MFFFSILITHKSKSFIIALFFYVSQIYTWYVKDVKNVCGTHRPKQRFYRYTLFGCMGVYYYKYIYGIYHVLLLMN